MTLLRRVAVEKRATLLPLGLALLANIAAYAIVVNPLQVKSATASERAARAEQSARAAERELAAAHALVTGKSRADEELATFYQKVLPHSEAAARDLTYLRVPKLASQAHVRILTRNMEPDLTLLRTAHLGCLRSRVVLTGDYEGLRQFIYELETSPEFIIIDAVSIAQAELNKPLNLTVALSTYYQP